MELASFSLLMVSAYCPYVIRYVLGQTELICVQVSSLA